MRWKKWIGGLALSLAAGVGCRQPIYMTEAQLGECKSQMLANIEKDPGEALSAPFTPLCPPPSTINKPDLPPRHLSLAEAISIALEQGTIGTQSVAQLTQASFAGGNVALDSLVQFVGNGTGGAGNSDAIRVLRLDPAIIGAEIESSLSKFDAVWTNSATWNTTDRPVGTSLDVFQAAGQTNVIMSQDATVSTGVVKPLATGGVASLTFNTAYTNTNLPSRVNPSYRPTLQFGFEQPLAQGFGVEINQLRPSHPGSVLNPGTFNPQTTPEGILVTRIRYDQQRAEFERNIQIQLAAVEVAYWNLYTAYWVLYANEQGLRLGFESWRVLNERFRAGRAPEQDVAQARGQYELFRAQRIQALDDLLERERQLRMLMGMPISDGCRLVPSDSPTLAPYQPDWKTSLEEALTLRPELYMQRQEVKAAHMNLLVQEDTTRPDVRLFATYDFNDIGTRLDGPGPDNAFRNLAGANFSNWQVGLRANIPIGFRNASANVRIARLRLERAYEVLVDNERKTMNFLGNRYREIQTNYELVRTNRAQREAYGNQLRGQFELVRTGTQTTNFLLEAERFYVTALISEFQSIRDYNNSLATFEFAKGTIMQHDNVVIGEGQLPRMVAERAVEHQRERTAALVLRERAAPVPQAPCKGAEGAAIPQIPAGSAPALPALLPEKGSLHSLFQIPEPLPPADAAKPAADAPKAAKPPEARPESLPGMLPPVGDGAAPSKPATILPLPAKPAAGTVSPPDLGLGRPTVTPLSELSKPAAAGVGDAKLLPVLPPDLPRAPTGAPAAADPLVPKGL